MRRFLLCSLVSGLVVTMSSLSARACINDREVNNAEREFKSQYQEKPVSESPASEPSPPSTSDQFKEYGPLALGGVLLVGAMVQVRRRSKA
ncbi:MAG TPA: hypothetical protein VH575_36220 [Gemmataceae bacterium]|jgi:hypothetical protein